RGVTPDFANAVGTIHPSFARNSPKIGISAMPIVTIDDFKANSRIEHDDEDDLIEGKIAAAQSQIESWLGFNIVARYSNDSPAEIPADLKQAVLALAAHLYEVREASIIGVSIMTVPM